MPVLVLNSSLQPLSVIPERRLIVLLSKQKVTFVDDRVRRVIEESISARRLELERPVIVQLLANVRVPRVALQPTRANILLRDDETCQYCGKRGRDLTLDHIIPRSRGGQSTWENLVASCKSCNGKKGSHLLKRSTCVFCASHARCLKSTRASSCYAIPNYAKHTKNLSTPRKAIPIAHTKTVSKPRNIGNHRNVGNSCNIVGV